MRVVMRIRITNKNIDGFVEKAPLEALQERSPTLQDGVIDISHR
jgi:hypothetical protein